MYTGGVTNMVELDIDELSFRDLEDFAKDFKYDIETSIVYFKTNGRDFTDGASIVYDDASVRKLTDVCMPYGRIQLYVDHLIRDVDFEKNHNQTEIFQISPVLMDDDVEDSDGDSDYKIETETDSTEKLSDNSDFPISDEEEMACKDQSRLLKKKLSNASIRTEVLKKPRRNELVNRTSSGEDSYNSRELRSLSSSSEDEISKKGYIGDNLVHVRKRKERLHTKEMHAEGSIKFHVGMRFLCMQEFRTLVREYGVKERRGIYFAKNDALRCQVICEENCPFYIWCCKDKNSENVRIKTLIDEHLCTKPYHNKLATVKYLGQLYGDKIRKNPQWRVKDMIETIKHDLEVEVPRIKCIRVRKAALEGVYESLKDHYARVYDFGYELLKNNSKNTVKIMNTRLNLDDEAKFQRIYICYEALKQGWKAGCRPVLGLDGCFLKTICRGQLISAVGRDGNDQMYPIAFAVVESENTESWRWFLELLGEDLNIGDGYGFTIISDQQKGLEIAMREYMPYAEHRFCTRHLYSNFRKRFPSQLLRRAFWTAACATHPVQHQKAMKEIQKQSKPAYEQLLKLDPKVWTKSHFGTSSKADNVENNMSESFNAWIITERFLPSLNMIQDIHFKLMARITKKREEILQNDFILCPRIKKKLDWIITESRKWDATWDGAKKFAVRQGTSTVTVDLVNRTCDCRVFQLTGIPCPHAVSAIHSSRQQPTTFVSDYYTREKYLQSYSYPLEALKGEEFWEFESNQPLLPPDIPKKLRGRPKKLRRREDWEGGNRTRSSQVTASQVGFEVQRFDGRRVMHCSLFGEAGHRKNKCPNPKGPAKETNDDRGKAVQKEGQQGEESNNKPKRAYKPKRKANVSWRSNKTAQMEATEEDIVYRAEHSDADDEQEGNYIQRRQKLTVRRRLPVSLQED